MNSQMATGIMENGVGDMPGYDTSLREYALRKQRKHLERERCNMVEIVCETLRKNRRKYHIKAAYIVGSLLQPRRWYPFSDIDVAVSGCSRYLLAIMKELEEATGKEVDVINLDMHLSPGLFVKRGMKVYG